MALLKLSDAGPRGPPDMPDADRARDPSGRGRDRRGPRPVEEMYVSFPTLDDFRDSRGHDLSGGEQQMLSVSVAESD